MVEPDFYRISKEDTLESAYKNIISIALYLRKFPYVNFSKMGLQGSSWGGIQTNYIVTRTHLFAAACSASSNSDFVSGYGQLSHGGTMDQEYAGGALGSIWKYPGWYITHSPVMRAIP